MKKLKLKLTTKRKKLSNAVRRSTIFPSFIGFTIAVYDGRKNVPVYIQKKVW